MTHSLPLACIFGGTGFIGRQVVRELSAKGYRLKIATRVPERAYELKTCGTVGQIVPVFCDYTANSVAQAVQGCDLVVNCVGILFERGRRNTFQKIHAELPGLIAKACYESGVKKYIHLSALGVDRAQSKYAQSKKAGEEAAQKAFPSVTILRPSIVFGAGDGFFNLFARLSLFMPVLPLIGGGHTRFQPVFVGDVADAVVKASTYPECAGHIYELGGPDIYTFRELYDLMFRHTGRPRPLISLPWGIAKIQGTLMGFLPRPLLTADQVETLKTDNVVSSGALTLRDLGIEGTALSTILPTYLSRFRPGGRFGDKKAA
ncbi:MAG: complex I NDUFA9 subunit family protein [Alphaproteobacteria bacterium]|nr:complex I NDUFA9 subunit family protein [Alphaproteobacteria bacterium]